MPSSGQNDRSLRERLHAASVPGTPPDRSPMAAPAETRLWLHAKHPLLNIERAIDLIIADRTQEVLAVVERLDAGAYL